MVIKVILCLLAVCILIIVFAYIDYKYIGMKCDKCNKRMTRKFIIEHDCEEFTCPNCGYKTRIYG